MRRAVIDGQDRLLVVVRDIDERKRATEREHRVGAGLRAAIEAAQELMIVPIWIRCTGGASSWRAKKSD